MNTRIAGKKVLTIILAGGKGSRLAPLTDQVAKPAVPENAQCKQARSNLSVLKGSSNVQIDSDGDGKPDRLLSADEHANQVKLAESTIAVSCAPAKP